MESLKNIIVEGKEEKFVNCYFLCKISDGLTKFKGFNNESIKINISDLENIIFENNQIYYFEKLIKIGNFLYFIKGKSLIGKNDGIIITDNKTSFNNSEPYSFKGKIVKKEEKQITFLTSINKIIILLDIGSKFNDYDENQFIKVSSVKFIYIKNEIVYFQLHFFSKINKLDKIDQENHINQKIAIKLKLLF